MDVITACRACGSERLEGFFDLGRQPLANALMSRPDATSPALPLSLSRCPDCFLVQLNETVDPRELFSNYVWVTSTSSTACDYAQTFCRRVLERTGALGERDYVLEIASNDGTFLRPFMRRGIDVLGVDPANNIVEAAGAEGVPTECAFFDKETAQRIVEKRGLPRVVIARNVLPHVADLHGFLDGLCVCGDEDTLFVVEVHDAGGILADVQYDSIYHEHLCYFSFESLRRLFESHDLFIEDMEPSPISGGSFVLFARRTRRPVTETIRAVIAAERASGVNELRPWRRFAEIADDHRGKFRGLLAEAGRAGDGVVGWGASARSSTLLNYAGVGSEAIPVIADKSRHKQGLYTAGSGIPITSPELAMGTKPKTVVVLAWNFADEIAGELRERFDFSGAVLVPFPHPPRMVPIREPVYA